MGVPLPSKVVPNTIRMGRGSETHWRGPKSGGEERSGLRAEGAFIFGGHRRVQAGVKSGPQAPGAGDDDQMLARTTEVNEVTIAYRHHASQDGGGGRFPLAADLVVTNANQVGFQAFVFKDDGEIDPASMRVIPTTL
jgi:hypothetical protein